MDWQDELKQSGCSTIEDEAFARFLDSRDELAHLRDEFNLPNQPAPKGAQAGPEKAIYLCGNSLGLMPKRTKALIDQELEVWSDRCAE